MFPEAFPETPVVQIERTNTVYQGWDLKVDHLFSANGARKSISPLPLYPSLIGPR